MHQSRRERRLLFSSSKSAPEQPKQPEQPTAFSASSLFASTSTSTEQPDVRPNILTVCTGNICRSPLAELVLASRLADVDVMVHSAGTHAMVGSNMPGPARELAEQNGVTRARTTSHRGRLLTESILGDADLVLTMTAQHSTSALELVPRRLHQTFTVREFARLASTLSDDELRSAADTAGNARSRLSATIQRVAGQRGTAPRATDDEDVIDPYRRSAEVYVLSAEQMMPGLAQVERVVKAALG